uniref:Uncharacterized protein n=1 Tax=Pipistrellus kuhlii TaxID=59472 RepID=A0A7J8B1W3_PIPKU|nr:hypothetical protein mPipKuh1_007828 [Pipistrellus kuhlii]
MPALLMSNCSPASLFAPNFPSLPAWSPLTARLCRVDCLQLPSLAGLVPLNCPPLQAWSLSTAFPCWPSCGGHLCPHRGRNFVHSGAILLCVGVMVNLHITLLLDRIEAWCKGGAGWFALKGVPDQGGGSLGCGAVWARSLWWIAGHSSGGPGIWNLLTFYN